MNSIERVYLDHNATTPISSVVRDRVDLWLGKSGNASSIHAEGRQAKLILREARERIARMINALALEIIFTSGGTESNNLAIKGTFDHARSLGRNHYLLSQVEHPSVRVQAEYLRSQGARVDWIPVTNSGRIDLDKFAAQLSDKTALVSVMLANNETGNIFPIRKMAEMAHAVGALMHSDCVQALGKIPVDVADLGIDLASFSGHKFYALKGVGILYARKGSHLSSLIEGGGQERHRRGGTENALAIASLGAMAECAGQVSMMSVKMQSLRDHMENRILNEIANVAINGVQSPRLPNTSSLIIAGVDGEILLMNLDLRGFAVSTGAACSSGSTEPSPALLAMGLTRAQAQSSLRVGLGWQTDLQQINRFVETLKKVVQHLRQINAEKENEEHVYA